MKDIEKIYMYLKNPFRLLRRMGSNTFLRLMSDETYCRLMFKEKMGYTLNLDKPKTFNEKVQWLNLIDNRPEDTQMVDKGEAKNFVAGIIGEDHIIPTIGVWTAFDDIDFTTLPNQFVLKCTHDSGGLVICRDKSQFNIEKARRKIMRSMKRNYYWVNRERPYKFVKPRIIAEEYLENIAEKGLIDYKFFCFHGDAKMVYVSKGLENHKTARMSFFDMEGNAFPFHRSDYRPLDTFSPPQNFIQMRDIAEKIARKIDNAMVRIDLYSVEGCVLFSEITFSPCAGMIPFEPKEWDEKLGDWITL